MTSATAFAPLLAPVIDDSMEVSSSPAGNTYEDEVLIDYDYDGTTTLTDDERMLEDGDADLTRPGTATDDMMEDAEPHDAPVHEEIMHDDPVAVAPNSYISDEELIDYSDEDYQDDTQVTLDDTTVQLDDHTGNSSLVPTENAIETENVIELQHVAEDIAQQPEETGAVEEPTANFLSAVAEDHTPGTSADDEDAAVAVEDNNQTETLQQDDAADELSRQVDAEEAEEAAAQELGVQFETDEPAVETADASDDRETHDETKVLRPMPKFPSGLDTTAYFAPDGPQTPSDTGIHPITVRYGDVVMPLFKSRVQPDGLLKDDNLASVSLGDLLDNCRHRLAIKIGESVSADQELVLSFENMGLQVIEVCHHTHAAFWTLLTLLQHSPHAFETSLDDVLEVYLSLHRNDATQAIPPLALSLSLQLKFTSSFKILKAAAQQGEGMSKFAFLHNGAEELDEYEEDAVEEEQDAEHEDHEDHEEHEEHQERQEDGADNEEHRNEGEETFAEDHADGEASRLEEGQEYEEDQYQEIQENEENDAGQSSEDHQDESNCEEYADQHQTDANDDSEHYGDGSKSLEQTADLHNEEDAPRPEVNDFAAQTAQESEEPVQPESTASSTTVRGDVADDTTGEYHNEDFIDFEDDDLTACDAELHVEDGNDDFSALTNEYEAEAVADDTAVNDEQKPAAADVTSDASALDFQQPTQEVDGEEAEDDTAPQEIANGVDADQHGQEEKNPADNVDLNENDLPGEDDEQLDTAFDLLEGHDFEHATEDNEPLQGADGFEIDDDDIGFNDDVEEAVLASNSPLGKRSFEEHVGKDHVTEEQDPKRPRS